MRQKRDVRPAGEIAAEQTAHRAGPNDPDFRSHMHALREVGYTGVIAVECRPYPDGIYRRGALHPVYAGDGNDRGY